MRLSLRIKLILSHTLPILILAPVFGFYLLSSLENFYYDRLKEDLLRGGMVLSEMLQADPALADDPARLQQIIIRVNAQTATRIQIIRPDGSILVSTVTGNSQPRGTISNDVAVQAALRGTPSENTAQGDIATVAVPIDSGKQGAVRLSLQLGDVEETFNRLNLLVVAATLVFTGISLGIEYALGATLSLPLQKLAREAKSVAHGDYSHRVEVKTGDEVGELAASFNGMVEQLAEQRAARERLLGDMAHELRRPIGALQSAAEVLRDGTPHDPGLNYRLLDGLHWEMGHLGRLTNRLAFAARDGHAPPIVKRDAVDVAAVVSRVVTLFAPEAQRRGITLTCNASLDLPLIKADEDALIEVFTNLLDNAIKFTPPGGYVSVAIGTTEDHLRIQVADTGMGLTPAEQHQLFKRFYRGDPKRPRPRGIGLGLAIASELVQAHGGTMRVSSQAEQGATFQIELPR